MADDLHDKSVKNVPFTGKRADYEKWSKRFLSYAQMKKVKKVLLGLEKPPAASESLNLDDKNDQDLQRIQQANDLAFNMLMLAVDDPISFEAVSSACTDSLPDGDAALAWEKLKNIYAKKSTTRKGSSSPNSMHASSKWPPMTQIHGSPKWNSSGLR